VDLREFRRKGLALPVVVERLDTDSAAAFRVALLVDISMAGMRLSLSPGDRATAEALLAAGRCRVNLKMPCGTRAYFSLTPCRVDDRGSDIHIGARISEGDALSHRALHAYLA
jgi:hypothetical protein